ncbi:MAG TPA: asparagine synthetase B family protein [Candidatus Binataceae bacterium]|nr:asparagine synthetase B family protein [Candidatus Binataceae bacterium]
MAQYLRYHYVPEPHSIYRHVKRLPAGHCMSWKDGALTVRSFHSPAGFGSLTGSTGGGLDRSASEKEVIQVLADSVSAHMIADVPVGVFLSGGVDSSLVAAMMRRASNADLHSFSIVFADRLKSADESEYARTVARHLETRHHEVVIDDGVLERLPETLGFFDEPFANPAALIAARLSEFASEHVKVVLSGVGGDEFFGGYPRYLALRAQRALGFLPGGLCDLAARATGLLPAHTDRKWMPDRIARLLNAGADLPLNFYDDLVAYSTPAQAAAVVNPDIAASVQWRDPRRLFDCRGAGSQALAMAADVAAYLPGDLLTYTDRCAMAYSLEVRTPLIDLEVARAACSLPSRAKTRGLQTKWMLKRIAATLVPPEVVYRKKKGFAVPIADWLRRSPHVISGVLSPASCRELLELNPAGVAALLQRHSEGDNSAAYLLWAVFSYVTWRKCLPAAASRDWEARAAVHG